MSTSRPPGAGTAMSRQGMRYAECECSSAGPMSPSHLRRLAPAEEISTGGWAGRTTLCGLEFALGWDIQVVTEEFAAQLQALAVRTEPGRVCPRCVANFESER